MPEIFPHSPASGSVNFPALCCNLVHRDLDHLLLPQDVVLIHDVDGIRQIGPGEEVTTTPDLLEIHLHIRRWDIPNQIQGPSTSMKFLGVQ